MSQFALRPVEVRDLDAIFEQMRDPESVRVAAFTSEDPNDRSAFDAHMAKVMSSSENTLRAIICDSRLVGTIASYVSEGATEVTYWIDRTCWGQGIATRVPCRHVLADDLHPRRAFPPPDQLRDAPLGQQPEALRPLYRFGPVAHAELLVDPAGVFLDGVL